MAVSFRGPRCALANRGGAPVISTRAFSNGCAAPAGGLRRSDWRAGVRTVWSALPETQSGRRHPWYGATAAADVTRLGRVLVERQVSIIRNGAVFAVLFDLSASLFAQCPARQRVDERGRRKVAGTDGSRLSRRGGPGDGHDDDTTGV